MKKPTQQQLKDSKWWDENDPTGGEATHFVLAGGGFVSAWRHLDDQGDWLSWRYDDGRDGEWAKIKGNDRYLINRPRSTQWKGPQDGLPPVGATHEDADLFGLGYSKPKYEVVAHHYNGVTAIVSVQTEDGIQYRPAKAPHFRPIQSERDKLADELHIEIAGEPIMGEETDDADRVSWCYGAVDAGYRKPMSRDDGFKAIMSDHQFDNISNKQIGLILDALGYKD